MVAFHDINSLIKSCISIYCSLLENLKKQILVILASRTVGIGANGNDIPAFGIFYMSSVVCVCVCLGKRLCCVNVDIERE